jgi:hypothetical protein
VSISASDDLRDLAEHRLQEARVLLQEREYSGAYYLAGYAIECGLKAVLTKDLASYRMPDKPEVVRAHTHDFKALATQGGLSPEGEPTIRIDWNVASSWSEASRYSLHGGPRAQEMVDAADRILGWLATKW